MSKKTINSLTVYLLLVWVFLFLLLIGSPDGSLLAKVLFAPFLLDISRGVGEFPALLFRGISSVTFMIMAVLVVLRLQASKKSTQSLLSLAGIVAITLHYGLVAVGYITTGLH